MENMFCRTCYGDLISVMTGECPWCGRAFDPADKQTYLEKPFPKPLRIMWQLLATTVLGIFAAYVVAFHQVAQTSGH